VPRWRMWAALVALLCAMVVVGNTPRAHAMQSGITGYSGKQGPTCNDSCHQGGVTPSVRFEGPQRVMTDAIATFRFVVTSQSSKQKVAGFNVAASDGTLGVIAGQSEHLEFEELTHDAPKPNVDGEAGWLFTWQAPSQTGVYTLYGAGLSANGNGTNGGDDSDFTTLDVTVVAEVIGDANCDRRVTAADVTAVVKLLPTGAPGTCAGADVDGDGAVDAADVAAAVTALFGD
jgi:hypothetical protein